MFLNKVQNPLGVSPASDFRLLNVRDGERVSSDDRLSLGP